MQRSVLLPRITRAGTLVLLVIVAISTLPAGPSAPATGRDRIAAYDFQYVVDPDGTVHVTETIDYVFGAGGNHGIIRELLTRTPYDEDRDRRYVIENFMVSSPTGASTEVLLSHRSSTDHRTEYAEYRIGAVTETVDPAETYVLSYDVVGALNAQEGDTELYWNTTGNRWAAQIDQVTVTVTVPGGARQIGCWVGPAGSNTPCEQAAVVDGKATFAAFGSDAGYGWGVTIAVGMDAAGVSVETILVDAPTYFSASGFTPGPLIAGAGILLLIAAYGIWARRASRDLRFAGVPPGVIPDDAARPTGGGRPKVVTEDGSITPPVAFSPPKGVSPPEAGYLRKGSPGADQLAATILDLAQRGVLQVGASNGGNRVLTLVDWSKATRPHETALLRDLQASQCGVVLVEHLGVGHEPSLGTRPGAELETSRTGTSPARQRALATHPGYVKTRLPPMDSIHWSRAVRALSSAAASTPSYSQSPLSSPEVGL